MGVIIHAHKALVASLEPCALQGLNYLATSGFNDNYTATDIIRTIVNQEREI